MRITPENITEVHYKDIFVFGSNEGGIHGGGAANLAYKQFGARWHQGFGAFGNTFAIPTKDWILQPLSLACIEFYVKRFLQYAIDKSGYKFYVTKIGCGLAGYTVEDIAPMFREALDLENVYLPQEFIDILNEHTISDRASSTSFEDGRGY